MSAETEILYCLIAHILMTFGVGIWLAKRRSLGLPLAYLVNLFIIHAGAFVYLNPAYFQSDYIRSFRLGEYTVARGYVMTCIGCAAFMLGIYLAEMFAAKTRIVQNKMSSIPAMKVAYALMVLGAIAFVGTKIQIIPPGLQAMFLVGRNAAAVGLSIAILYNLRTRNTKGTFIYFGLFLLIPSFYALFLGFLSFGTQFMIILVSLLLMQVKPVPKNILTVSLGSMLAAYAFVSVFVIYMDNRQALREILWSDADIGQRIAAMSEVVSKIGPYDYDNNVHMTYIDSRLNHNILVGKAIDQLEFYPDRYAMGRTMINALLSWVPRFIWPDKPTTGSTAILTEFTGQRFDESTAMQTGHIFEFYINFGWIGVAAGMLLYGFVLRAIDVRAAAGFIAKDYAAMAKYFLIGIVLVWPGDMLTSQLTAVAATVVFLFFIRKFYELQLVKVDEEFEESSPKPNSMPSYTRY